MKKIDLNSCLKKIERYFDTKKSQNVLQSEILQILRVTYSLAGTARNTTDDEQDKEFWNELRRILYQTFQI